MLPSLLLLASLPLISSTTILPPKPQILDPSLPIYIGDVFWPPSMTFIAWLPSEQHDLTEWCYRATDVSDNKLFTLGNIGGLQMHDYFAQNAYLTRDGRRWADCWITPESGRMGACEGVLDHDCVGGQRFTGPGTRRWSCWVVEGEREELRGRLEASEKGAELEGDVTSEVVKTVENGKSTSVLGSAPSDSIMGAFTPVVTGS